MSSENAESKAASNGVNGVETSLGPNVHVCPHPVLSHKLSILRSSSSSTSAFRAVLREVTYHLGYDATASLNTRPVQLTVPVGNEHIECTGKKIADRVALVPILRSGLGMIDSMRELLPNAAVHHIGMYRSNMMPVQYYNRLPRQCEADVAYILDPVIATACTILSLVSILKKWGVPKIHVISVIASRAGITELSTNHPDIFITLGTIDEELKNGVVLPGLGDAGDRLFGTHIEDDENLLHPSKRKRSDA